MSNKLDWKKKDPDESLYNAMIIALAIGIVIVIVTLFLTRPAPESFSELYFNNHTTLPEYINLNHPYDYSFTIHNLENKNYTYNYTQSIEYYNIDYSCERPELYLEQVEQSRITETNDPALYIKETNYAISFDYEPKAGMDRIALNLINVNNKSEYSVIIDHEANKLYYLSNNILTPINISKNSSRIHTFSMHVNNTNTQITLDQDSFILKTIPKSGFIQLETINTYAEFTNFIILRNTTNEIVAIRLADSQYTEYKLDSKNNTIIPNSSINLTNYNIKATFRTLSTITLQLRPNTAITYNKDLGNLVINDSNHIEKYYVESKTINDISANVNNKSIDIYYNDEFITSFNNSNTTLTPSITYSNVTVNSFYIKANDAPITINYALTEVKQTTQTTAGLLTPDTLKYFKSEDTAITPSINNITAGLNANELVSLETYYDKTKITSTNYRIITIYIDTDRNNNFNVALTGMTGPIYTIAIDDKNQTASVVYFANKTLINATYNITPLSANRLIIDVNNSTLFVSLNNKNLFSKLVDKSTDGLLLFDYTTTLVNAQVEDRTTGVVTVFQKQLQTQLQTQLNTNCDPILLNKYIYLNSTTIADKNSTIIKDSVRFNQTFDIAKVQVSLDNDQEIHYWVKLI